MFAGRAEGRVWRRRWGGLGGLRAAREGLPCRPGRSDLAVRGYTRVPGRLGFPSLLGISSVGRPLSSVESE